MTIANYIYIAVISGYYSKSDWQKWADEEILNNYEVEEWVYNVSLAKDTEELYEAIYEKRMEESYYQNNEFLQEDVVVGYYYMLYGEKRINLYELINRLSDEDDISSSSSIHEIQNFYTIFKEINENNGLIDNCEFIEKIVALLEPYRKLAEEQKIKLDVH
ncbi:MULTISPECIES: hypothetical protein [unclassified Clostridium]|uniref:hypothetical protein n=1 Tax=unclassified Clostridium TaxID=2614128 RepID=UPI0013F6A20D|nr:MULTISPECIES: hypothetical protein [unclassified Clostridium]NFN94256.1 hypothetical protein [Clostridium botulinum]NFS97732.1 hypothetical protein [Clostridium botulinum]